MKIDETRITQVLNNLISNALNFTGPGGSITVTIRQQQVNDSFIALSVQDTGCGIAASELERIFDRLFQVQDTHDRQAGGLGLGLGISREVVKLHGGTLQVESQLGKEVSFHLIFLLILKRIRRTTE
ncbi:MAG: ATP-binding protein [Nitrospirae bacterium]|nr:ATP-binding protein [Nitrospirota bacterium]